MFARAHERETKARQKKRIKLIAIWLSENVRQAAEPTPSRSHASARVGELIGCELIQCVRRMGMGRANLALHQS
jgi:hypothetical protein